MLIVSKGNTSLRVRCAEREVFVSPVVREHDNEQLLSTFARNEELLAQLFLYKHLNADPMALLATYFMQRGWQVKKEA